MIRGHGIDLQELQAIEQVVSRRPQFAKRVLTPNELERYQALKGKRKLEYLAGRWSAKEAFFKALGTGLGKYGFQDVEILTDERGAPLVRQELVSGRFWISISHSAAYVEASVIWEEAHDQ
ncbi:holo-ACP synthase [Streptococcus sp. DD13]|uniref:holo-ACP synthase n=1 Tax=Streptococcus sp. DD13 TaxID=1777881 RepID=UPI00082EAF98|nr:holo-ACP synthase [Streptococcus sp. DD13]